MSPLLQTLQLTKRYPNFTLHPTDFSVEPGTITGLIGENGAGKSTLIKLILGLLKPSGGEIRIFRQVFHNNDHALRTRIGFVQESPGLWPFLTIAEIGKTVAPFYPNWHQTRFKDLCQRFEIPPKTPFQNLSQGNRMKAALAIALSHDAELLILDEPTSGLDPLSRRELLDLLLEVVQDEHRAVLFSTHITTDLDRVADHIAFMRQGRLVLSGVKDEVLEQWRILKGGRELLNLVPKSKGGSYNDQGVTLLCEASSIQDHETPPNALWLKPKLDDLIYFYDRQLTTAQERA